MKRKRSNPASSASQYGAAEAVVSGRSNLMPRSVARELIRATPARLRSKFAKELAARRRRRNATIRQLKKTLKRAGHDTRTRRQVVRTAKGYARARKLVRAERRNPARRRNQETKDRELIAAEKMFHKFTGRRSKGHQIVEQVRVTPSALADLGRMVELTVHKDGEKAILHFNGTGVRLGATGDGGQLYFVKGDQAISTNGHAGKDHLDLGTAHRIVYFTSKDFHNFEPSEYSHKFGEEDVKDHRPPRRPTLHYDVRSKRLYLTGGAYRVKREGIVN